ncbi:MAG: hypothetical protein HQL83_15980 [Magnetococcales bacterium]|nr:hypothetical protein [Magnetococcales bacterium]
MATHPFRDQPLPALREDLAITPGPVDSLDGAPTWIIQDALRHRFYRIGVHELRMLDGWEKGITVATLHDRLNRKNSSTTISWAELADWMTFLRHNQLLAASGQVKPPNRPGWWQSLLTHYLFFRIPLWSPDPFLQRLLPLTKFFHTSWYTGLQVVLFLSAWFMTMRQWDRFVDSIPEVFDPGGAITLACAVVLAKGIHELGHALTAKRLGVHVPTMGIAFLVLWPVPYSELSEAWKISSRRARMAIAWAGIKAELGLAIWATWLWNLWPDGAFREALFLLAGTTWMTTLAINLSPFMRFDGYFLLSDGLDIPNLHARAFAMGRWWLRCRLLGVSPPPPEPWSVGRRRFLIVFAWVTWIYRLMLFVTIALVVYHFFFKLLGMLLWVVELTWFVLRPVALEMKEWGTCLTGPERGIVVRRLMGWLMAGMVLVLYPWPNVVEVAAVLRPEHLMAIYPPRDGKIRNVWVTPGQLLNAGDPMIHLGASALDLQLELSQARTHVLQRRLELAATVQDLEHRESLSRQLAREWVRHEGLQAQQDRMTLTAPMAGRVVTMMDHLHEGAWIGAGTSVLTLAAPEWQVEGFVGEADLHQMVSGRKGRFHSMTVETPAVSVQLRSVALSESRELDLLELASIHGGPIPATQTSQGRSLARNPVYRVVFSLIGEPPKELERVHRGWVMLSGDEESIGHQWIRWMMALWIRERQF